MCEPGGNRMVIQWCGCLVWCQIISGHCAAPHSSKSYFYSLVHKRLHLLHEMICAQASKRAGPSLLCAPLRPVNLSWSGFVVNGVGWVCRLLPWTRRCSLSEEPISLDRISEQLSSGLDAGQACLVSNQPEQILSDISFLHLIPETGLCPPLV